MATKHESTGFWLKILGLVLTVAIAAGGVANAYFSTKAEAAQIQGEVKAVDKRVTDIKADVTEIRSDVKTLLQRIPAR